MNMGMKSKNNIFVNIDEIKELRDLYDHMPTKALCDIISFYINEIKKEENTINNITYLIEALYSFHLNTPSNQYDYSDIEYYEKILKKKLRIKKLGRILEF